MSRPDPYDLLFGGMAQLGPGSDAETRRVLGMLPERAIRLVVDAGCGTGRQTLVLARELGVAVHAIDNRQPFLDELARRARAAGLAALVRPRCMDMAGIPAVYSGIDLLWSEGAAYSIGFTHALEVWAPALAPGGRLVASELVWLRARAPDAVREFLAGEYPDIASVAANRAAAEAAGYRVLATHELPAESWVEGYYDVLLPRARTLLDHPDEAVRALAGATLHEIEIFRISDASYGYVFFLLERP